MLEVISVNRKGSLGQNWWNCSSSRNDKDDPNAQSIISITSPSRHKPLDSPWIEWENSNKQAVIGSLQVFLKITMWVALYHLLPQQVQVLQEPESVNRKLLDSSDPLMWTLTQTVILLSSLYWWNTHKEFYDSKNSQLLLGSLLYFSLQQWQIIH